MENLPKVLSVVADSGLVVDCTSQYQDELSTMESEIETFFSATLDNESSSDIKDPTKSSIPTTRGGNLDFVNGTITTSGHLAKGGG